MKRLIALVMILIFALTGCGGSSENQESIPDYNSGLAESGIWISYSEINSMFSSPYGFENEILTAVENCKDLGIENVYIHVRAFCDSIFKSEYFPLSKSAESYSGDALEFIINSFHSKDIKVHAWLNPYRVLTSSSDVNVLDTKSPAYKWLKDENKENDKNVCIWEGIYLNPAEPQVQRLIIDGVKEILNRYSVDGIHFDDYFYPTTDSQFDIASYESYKSSVEKPLGLADWRRANVNSLLSGCYSAIKYINQDIVFSISPAASIEKNLNELYADVEGWINGGYIDCIIPQLYFGFNYSQREFRFENILESWKRLIGYNQKIKLQIGLASYKIGSENEFDGDEWITDTDIIARQAEICRKDGIVSGYVLFSYSSVFGDEKLNQKQRENFKKIIREEN